MDNSNSNVFFPKVLGYLYGQLSHKKVLMHILEHVLTFQACFQEKALSEELSQSCYDRAAKQALGQRDRTSNRRAREMQMDETGEDDRICTKDEVKPA